MQVNNLALKIGGQAGMGIKVIGLSFAKVCTRSGLFAFGYLEYPSLIRGGHNTYHITVRPDDVKAQCQHVDLLLAFNKETAIMHSQELSAEGAILYDGESFELKPEELGKKVKLYPIPLMKFAKEAGTEKMINTAAMGAILALLDYDLAIFKDLIKEEFADKGEEIVKGNYQAAEAGYRYAKDHYATTFAFKLKKVSASPKMFITGNDAVVIGAVKAGVKMLAAYPMTPATSIMQGLAALEEDYNIIVKHTEDEIAAMAMINGAVMAGVRAMTCTSGGGFALMNEAFGMAGMAEQPVVAVVSQRGVPATGLPTWTGQGDLRFVTHAAPGDNPRIIIAPGDATESFYETFNAFNLAEKYQLPVIILLDKYLSESSQSVEYFDIDKLQLDRGKLLTNEELAKIKNYKRYEFTADGISSRAVPGQPEGEHVASTYEHNEYGTSTEDEKLTSNMNDKRWQKLAAAMADIPAPQWYGPADADLTIISWGSNKGPILEALELLKEKGLSVNYLHFTYVWPLPASEITKAFAKIKNSLLLEVNKTAQFGGLLKQYAGIDIPNKFLKYGGRQYWPEEVARKAEEFLKTNSQNL